MRKIALFCLLVFSIALHAQEHSENNTMENPFKNGTEIRSLSVEIGPSWINSKVYTSEGEFKLCIVGTGNVIRFFHEDLRNIIRRVNNDLNK